MTELTKATPELLEEDVNHLADFFDLLAKFDFEDHLTEKSVLNSNPLVSAPSGLELATDLAHG